MEKIKQFKYIPALLAGLLFCTTASVSGNAQDYVDDTGRNTVRPDNTGINKRDRAPEELTADQQQNNEADRDLTQRIRKALMADKSLSSYARNIKIISEAGTVTLKGPVRSDSERNLIVQKALDATGSADRVVDQISIAPKRKGASHEER